MRAKRNLRHTPIASVAAATLLAAAIPAGAQQIIESYTARIGAEDRRNSSGMPLERVEQFLQQDRANVNRFGVLHRGDRADGFFTTLERRSDMSRLLAGGRIAPDARAAILAGQEPLLRVEIHGVGGRAQFVTVDLVDDPRPITGDEEPSIAAAESTEPPQEREEIARPPRRTGQGEVPSGPLRGSVPANPAPTLPGIPPFDAALGCELTQRGGYRLRCRGANGEGVPSERLQGVRSQLAIHTLGCDVAVIDGHPNSDGGAACFLDLFGINQTRLTGRQQMQLATLAGFVRREDIIARLARMGYVLASERAVADASEAESGSTGASPLRASPTAQEQRVWEAYGLRLDEENRRAFVSEIRPDGPAAQQGLRPGDRLDGNDIWGANRTKKATLDGLTARLEQAPERGLLLYIVPDGGRFQEQITLVPSTAGAPSLEIPPALRVAMATPGFAALMRGDGSAPRRAEDIAAMDALWAISRHRNGCAGPGAVTIPVSIQSTTVTRDGVGIVRNQQSSTSMTEITVRRAFEGWTRSKIDLFPRGVISRPAQAVLDAINIEGCTGASMAALDRALSDHLGVQPREGATEATATPAGIIPPTKDAFMAACIPMQREHDRRRGAQHVERGGVTACFCSEHAGRAIGDGELYTALREADLMGNSGISILQSRPDSVREEFGTAFSACYRAPSGSELRLEVEAIWRRMGI